jgi:TnpA family transposase
MPRRELLTPTERAGLLAFPTDESELIRLATLSAADVTFIRHQCGHHNRLGIAVQMQYLRFPGRVLLPAERPHPTVLGIVAAQIRAAPAAWDLYATRDETRREHLLELLKRLGKKRFTRAHYRTSVEFLLPLALQSTQGIVLARALAPRCVYLRPCRQGPSVSDSGRRRSVERFLGILPRERQLSKPPSSH